MPKAKPFETYSPLTTHLPLIKISHRDACPSLPAGRQGGRRAYGITCQLIPKGCLPDRQAGLWHNFLLSLRPSVTPSHSLTVT